MSLKILPYGFINLNRLYLLLLFLYVDIWLTVFLSCFGKVLLIRAAMIFVASEVV